MKATPAASIINHGAGAGNGGGRSADSGRASLSALLIYKKRTEVSLCNSVANTYTGCADRIDETSTIPTRAPVRYDVREAISLSKRPRSTASRCGCCDGGASKTASAPHRRSQSAHTDRLAWKKSSNRVRLRKLDRFMDIPRLTAQTGICQQIPIAKQVGRSNATGTLLIAG